MHKLLLLQTEELTTSIPTVTGYCKGHVGEVNRKFCAMQTLHRTSPIRTTLLPYWPIHMCWTYT